MRISLGSTQVAPMALAFFNVDFMAPVTPLLQCEPKPMELTRRTARTFMVQGTLELWVSAAGCPCWADGLSSSAKAVDVTTPWVCFVSSTVMMGTDRAAVGRLGPDSVTLENWKGSEGMREDGAATQAYKKNPTCRFNTARILLLTTLGSRLHKKERQTRWIWASSDIQSYQS